MSRHKHVDPITDEFPRVKREYYKPLKEGDWHFISFDLTKEQHYFIDDVAKTYNITHNEAFKRVFNDGFNLLTITVDRRKTYASLPCVLTNDSNPEG